MGGRGGEGKAHLELSSLESLPLSLDRRGDFVV